MFVSWHFDESFRTDLNKLKRSAGTFILFFPRPGVNVLPTSYFFSQITRANGKPEGNGFPPSGEVLLHSTERTKSSWQLFTLVGECQPNDPAASKSSTFGSKSNSHNNNNNRPTEDKFYRLQLFFFFLNRRKKKMDPAGSFKINNPFWRLTISRELMEDKISFKSLWVTFWPLSFSSQSPGTGKKKETNKHVKRLINVWKRLPRATITIKKGGD